MATSKEVENKVREYFKKKYGVYPNESQLKNSIGSLGLLGKVIFHFLSRQQKI